MQVIPGITFGAGEGGGGYGDSINCAVMPPATTSPSTASATQQYSRTDPFNLQQIEVYNGANSVFNGSGSVGGTINLVSKVPTPETLTIAQGAVSTTILRGTIDANVRASDLVALRLNAAYHHNRAPGRDVEKFERWGVAPAVTIGVDGPTSASTLAYVHQEDRNTPIYGVPYFRNGVSDGVLPGGQEDAQRLLRDRQPRPAGHHLDRLTATFRHAVSNSVSVRNLTRWQRVGVDTVTSAPQGTYCLAATGLSQTGGACTATFGDSVDTAVYRPGTNSVTVTVPRGFYQPSGPRGLLREQENRLLADQTDVRVVTGAKGGVRNTANVGLQMQVEPTPSPPPRCCATPPVRR
ncbi:hypothetical protein AB5I41_20225 [Sphingomonas sp. MMS24-JH45]